MHRTIHMIHNDMSSANRKCM